MTLRAIKNYPCVVCGEDVTPSQLAHRKTTEGIALHFDINGKACAYGLPDGELTKWLGLDKPALHGENGPDSRDADRRPCERHRFSSSLTEMHQCPDCRRSMGMADAT